MFLLLDAAANMLEGINSTSGFSGPSSFLLAATACLA